MSDMGEGFIYRGEDQDSYLVECVKALFSKHGPIRIRFTKYRNTHSRSQENLFWAWMTVMDQKFYRREKTTQRQKVDIHDLMCSKFLGYTEKLVGKTAIKGLRTLTWPEKLDKGEMAHFMKQVECWAAEHGCLLPVPDDNDYAKHREAV